MTDREELEHKPMLTAEEREAIWTVAEAYGENSGDPECERIAIIIHGLWRRCESDQAHPTAAGRTGGSHKGLWNMSKTLNVKSAAAVAGAAPCSAKPCKQNCPKCGASDIHREHREKGEEVDKRNLDDACKSKSPFLTSNWPYGYKATKEHIGHHCRDCGYEWQSAVLPNAQDNPPREDTEHGR